MAWAPSSCCCAHLQRVVPCLCCSCTTVSWGHSSSQHLLLPGSHGQHLPELCSPGGESSIISYEFSSLFLGNQFQRLILAHICTQQHPVKSTCGRCSFWRSWRSDSDSCQCPVLQSDISRERVLCSNLTLCPPVHRTASCQGWSWAHSGLVGVFGPGESQQGWINPHSFNDARRGFSKRGLHFCPDGLHCFCKNKTLGPQTGKGEKHRMM